MKQEHERDLNIRSRDHRRRHDASYRSDHAKVWQSMISVKLSSGLAAVLSVATLDPVG